MRVPLLIFIGLLVIFPLKGQVNLDSLYAVWKDPSQTEEIRTNAYSDYIWDGYLFSQPDSGFILAEELVSFGKDRDYLKAQFAGYTLQGVSWVNRSDYSKTLEYYMLALEVAQQMEDSAPISIAYNNLGSVYHDKGDLTKALEYYIQSLDYNQPLHVATTLSNIGTIYLTQENFEKALEYYQKSLELNRTNGDQHAEAINLDQIGDCYRNQDDFDKSLDYYNQSLQIFEKINNRKGIADTYSKLGVLYDDQSVIIKALDYHLKSLTHYEQIGDLDGVAVAVNNIGNNYRIQGNLTDAKLYCERGFELSEKIQSPVRKQASCSCLYEISKETGNGEEALRFLELLNSIEDSLNFQETSKKLQQMEFKEEARIIQEEHKKEVLQKDKIKNISLVVGAFFLFLALSFYFRWRFVHKAKASIQLERDRSENLLLNILPEEIALELKEKGKADAREFDMVSILFTDFKNFTEQGAKLSAAELVNDINYFFEAFDAISEKHGIEKIKTIGDAYMAAGGLPVPSDDAVKRTVLAALEMQEFIKKRQEEKIALGKHAFEMRAGIHTGPVVAGIVGIKKFQYDIWGDTVNTASRLESSGQVGKVNISQTTYELLKDDPEFNFESRGKIVVKGKGEMNMYFVTKNK